MSTQLQPWSAPTTRSANPSSAFPIGLSAEEWRAGQRNGDLDGAMLELARTQPDRFFEYLRANRIERLPTSWAQRQDEGDPIRSARWRLCLECGVVFEVDSRHRQQRRCDECAPRHKLGVRRRPLPARQCPHCWLVFTPGRADQRYCTDNHRKVASNTAQRRDRRASEIIARAERLLEEH
jgi:hypothetical protein